MDHVNKPSNPGVGAVLENVVEPTWKEAVINVESGCKDVKNCECDVKLTSLKMTSPLNHNYIVGEPSKLNFDLVLENSGDESALNTPVQLISSIINPTNNVNNKPKGDVSDVEEFIVSTTTEGNSEEKLIWQWKIPTIGKKRSKTASFKFQLDKVNFTGQESPLEKFNIKVIPWCKRTSTEFNHTVDQTLSFKHESKVRWEKLDTDEEKKTVLFDDDSGDVPFSQTFKITNKGPSPTQEKSQLKIYVPETVNSKSVQIDGKDGWKNCTKKASGTIPLSMTCKGAKEVIACQGKTICADYTCDIDADWSKGKSYEIKVPMFFSSKDAKHSAYAVCVHAKVEGIYSNLIFTVKWLQIETRLC